MLRVMGKAFLLLRGVVLANYRGICSLIPRVYSHAPDGGEVHFRVDETCL